jgi:ankyrin repeat protein
MHYKNNAKGFEACVTQRDEEDWTPLMHAAAIAREDRVLMILNALEAFYGNDYDSILRILNAQGPYGKTALYLAVERRHTAVVKVLLSRVGELFKDASKHYYFNFLMQPTHDFDWTPLFIAVYDSASDIIRLLVLNAEKYLGKDSQEFKHFMNEFDDRGKTPIMLSIEPRDRLFLISHGAKDYPPVKTDPLAGKLQYYIDQPQKDKEVKSILDDAQQRYQHDKRAFLDFITTRDNGGWTPLMNAVGDGSIGYVRLILESLQSYFKDPADRWWIASAMNNADNHGRTSFHLAITRRHFEIAKLLIDKEQEFFGNDPHILFLLFNQHTEFNGFTPLIIAAYISSDDENSYVLIRKMVQRGLDVFGKNTLFMDHFINARDLEHQTAYAYVIDPRTREFMKKAGAQ